MVSTTSRFLTFPGVCILFLPLGHEPIKAGSYLSLEAMLQLTSWCLARCFRHPDIQCTFVSECAKPQEHSEQSGIDFHLTSGLDCR